MLHEMLLKLRTQKGLSQNLAAEGLSVSRDAYVRYENGSRTPNADFLRNVCTFYKVSADYVLELTDNPHRFWAHQPETPAPAPSTAANLSEDQPRIPTPDTLAAHETAGAFPVSKERMEEIVIQAYHLIMAQRAFDAAGENNE